MQESNPMRALQIDKVTINIGVGSPGEHLEKIKGFMENYTKAKFVETKAKKRNPVFKLRPGLTIGIKTTLRGKFASEFLNKALDARKRKLSEKNFDEFGNFSFGIKECIDLPGVKYDPNVGVFGFDVCVTLKRRGKRVAERMHNKTKIGKTHLIKKEEAIIFAKESLNVNFVDK